MIYNNVFVCDYFVLSVFFNTKLLVRKLINYMFKYLEIS